LAILADLGIEVDHALEISEQTEVLPLAAIRPVGGNIWSHILRERAAAREECRIRENCRELVCGRFHACRMIAKEDVVGPLWVFGSVSDIHETASTWETHRGNSMIAPKDRLEAILSDRPPAFFEHRRRPDDAVILGG
jgi:hypothetical protein